MYIYKCNFVWCVFGCFVYCLLLLVMCVCVYLKIGYVSIRIHMENLDIKAYKFNRASQNNFDRNKDKALSHSIRLRSYKI